MPDTPVFHVLQPVASPDPKQLSEALRLFDSLRGFNEAALFVHDLIHGADNLNDAASFEKHATDVRQKHPDWLLFVEIIRNVKPTGFAPTNG